MPSLNHFKATLRSLSLPTIKYRYLSRGPFPHHPTFVFADGLVTYESTDDVPWTTDGRPSDNEFIDNTVSNTPLGIRFSDGDDNVVTGGKLSTI